MAAATLTHAITIRAPRGHVWPWLAQMGASPRAGWYSWDWLDNGGTASARRIVPELQQLRPGMTFPAAPAATDAFTLLSFEPERSLVLGWLQAGKPITTWAFSLEDIPHGTRLIVRVRAGTGYRIASLPSWLMKPVIVSVHAFMQRRQLHGIAARAETTDLLLDRFIPVFDIVERHHRALRAPAAIVLAAARAMDLSQSLLFRAIVRTRAIALHAGRDERTMGGALLEYMQSIGWRVLADLPGREVVVGAVTKPWEANVVFRSLAPEAFAAFDEPGYIKIVWTLRADPTSQGTSIFRTETRVMATDAVARARFRRYWRVFSPGIIVIRWILLARLRAELVKRQPQ